MPSTRSMHRFLCLTTLLTGLAGAAEVPQGDWTLAALTDGGRQVRVNANVAPSASFSAQDISGRTPCNTYRASLEAGAGQLKLGALTSTKRACLDRVGGLETQFLNLLGQARSFVQTDDRLVLSGPDGRLDFIRRAAVVLDLSGEWRLQPEGFGAEAPQGALPIRLRLKAGRVSGFSGCNSFGGEYQQQGGALEFGALAVTLRACADPRLAAREAAVLTLLRGRVQVELLGDRMTLVGTGGTRLNFVRPSVGG